MTSDASSVDHRALLEQERDDLRHQLAELGFGEEGSLEYDPNFADSSQVTAERGEVEALAAKLRSTLVDVEVAIEKLDAGTYGFCEKCGNAIEPARLEAMPAAKSCITCASSR